MKKLISLAMVGMFAITGVTVTGCGGSGDTRVVEGTPPPSMPEEEKKKYEEAMKKQMQSIQRGPGN